MASDPDTNSQRVALVTGSTSGIGKAIAQQLAGDGFAVAFHSRTSVDAGRELAALHAGATYTRADLSDQQQSQELVSTVLDLHGRLDVLVNNAGISAVIAHQDMKSASAGVWRELYEVNVIAPWTLIAESEAALRAASTAEQPSCIVNISSHAGVRAKGASIPYATSKAALNHMTRLLAVSLSPAIRVNAIAPGLVDTPMTAQWLDAQNLWKQKSPMGRGAKPEEIAHLASTLVASTYLTGEVILSDGGLNLT